MSKIVTIVAQQSIYLTRDRKRAVPKGPDAAWLLVAKGHEIKQDELEKYEGASDLAEKESKDEEPPKETPHPKAEPAKHPAHPVKHGSHATKVE